MCNHLDDVPVVEFGENVRFFFEVGFDLSLSGLTFLTIQLDNLERDQLVRHLLLPSVSR